MSAELVVLNNGKQVGTITRDRSGKLTFRYAPSWQTTGDATPLSTSMLLGRSTHGHEVVDAFLWGLLPDNAAVLERWGRLHHVSPRNAFSLLSTPVGEDCPGAIQLVPPERLGTVTSAGGVEWMSDDDVARRIRELREDANAWLPAGDTGQFSLAGAQAKTALLYDEATGRWGRPYGQTPTTHIIKPAIRGLDDHDLNEHLCLQAVRLLGLAAVTSSVQTFDEETALVVKRYDRVSRDGEWVRVHQEDLCQALAVHPDRKYQNEGGPSPVRIIELLRDNVRPPRAARESVDRFVDALVINWLIAGTDGHAKNFALLLHGHSKRLAPLYDISSALPYGHYEGKLKLAMQIGGHYRLRHIVGRHWRRFAEAAGLDDAELISRARRYAQTLPDAFMSARKGLIGVADGSGLPDRLVDLVARRAQECLSGLEA